MALEDYPIEVENNEKGYLQTESLKSGTVWKPPFDRSESLGASKYSIHIKLVRGRMDSLPVVKVLVLKKVFVQKGFMSAPQREPSSGLEEKNLLYRMLREISIEKAIARYHQSPSQADQE